MNEFWKIIVSRFIRAFVASAAASMLLIVPSVVDWHSLGSWLSALGIAGVVGGISGLLQAADKAYRWKE